MGRKIKIAQLKIFLVQYMYIPRTSFTLHNGLVNTLYLVHLKLAHIRTLDRNEIWAQDLYHSTALVEMAKKFSTLNYKRTWQSTIPETSAS